MTCSQIFSIRASQRANDRLTEGRVRRQKDALLFAVLLQFKVRKTRVSLHLVGCWDDGRMREQKLEILYREVRDTNRPDIACRNPTKVVRRCSTNELLSKRTCVQELLHFFPRIDKVGMLLEAKCLFRVKRFGLCVKSTLLVAVEQEATHCHHSSVGNG